MRTEGDGARPGAAGARNPAWRAVLGAVAGAVLVPAAVLMVAQIWNAFDPDCSGGGGEARLSCLLGPVVFAALALPIGALIGLFAGLVWKRRSRPPP
jgi:hypothetical protein